MNRRGHIKASYPDRTKGAALLVMLLVAVLAFSTFLTASLAKRNLEVARQEKTLEALAHAKQALIAWSVTQGDIGAGTYRRPGTLPCPDRNFFGSADSGYASGSCSMAGETSIGRLPWRSIGMGVLHDAEGELLWYAVSDSFRRPNNLNNNAINSDTKGTLLLYGPDGSTLLTPSGDELAAIIFAPGRPLPGQNRSTSPDAASSYLESFHGKDNAIASGPFVAGPAKDSNGDVAVNDLVIGITARELIAAIEKRALNEAQEALKSFAAINGHFPNPASPSGSNCTSAVTNVTSETIHTCASDSSICFGRLPEDILSPYVASWFLQNGWGRVMAYAVNANDAMDGSGAGCSTTLNVDGQTKRYILIAPGTPLGNHVRPATALSDYLEGAANADGWNPDPNFVTPDPTGNDQLRSSP